MFMGGNFIYSPEKSVGCKFYGGFVSILRSDHLIPNAKFTADTKTEMPSAILQLHKNWQRKLECSNKKSNVATSI